MSNLRKNIVLKKNSKAKSKDPTKTPEHIVCSLYTVVVVVVVSVSPPKDPVEFSLSFLFLLYSSLHIFFFFINPPASHVFRLDLSLSSLLSLSTPAVVC